MNPQYSSEGFSKKVKSRRPKVRLGRFFFIAQVTLMLGLVFWLGWRPANHAAKHFLARRAAGKARAAVMRGELPQAEVALSDALRWDPNAVAVIEASILYFEALGSNPATLLRQLRLLETQHPLSPEQQCLMGHTCVSLGKMEEARWVLKNLPAPHSTAAAELEAAIMKAEGMAVSAVSELTLYEDSNAPKVRLKKALNGLTSSFPELVQRSSNELWSLVEIKDPVAMKAVTALSTLSGLTISEAHRLLELVERHPQGTLKDKLRVVSALMRLQPEKRNAIIDDEITTFQRGSKEEQIELARWLAREKEHDRLLQLLPRQIIAKSPEYYAVVGDSLVNEGRWEQLREMLENVPPPASQHLALLWQAEVQSHVQPDLQETRRLLEASIDAARKNEDVVTLFKAAEFARTTGIADLATVAYKATAVFSDRQPVELLQKAYDMALQQKNTAELMVISRQLHELRPASAMFSSRLHYYNLLLGLDIEAATASVERMHLLKAQVSHSSSGGLIPLELLQALAAFRVGDTSGLSVHVSKLQDIRNLRPGERAVAAGLLALSGKVSDAYQIAEKVHISSLLNEEVTFLQRAR